MGFVGACGCSFAWALHVLARESANTEQKTNVHPTRSILFIGFLRCELKDGLAISRC
jgi:hypothetical protein